MKRIDKYGYWLTLAIVGSIFLGSGSIGINAGGVFLFPLRILCLIAFPFSIYAVVRPSNCKDIKHFLVLILLYGGSIGLLIGSQVYSEQLSVLQIGFTISMMIIGFINNKTRLHNLIFIWIIGTFLVNCIAFYEVATGTFVLNEMERGENFYQGMGFFRPISIYNNSNNLAFLNTISAVLLLAFLVSENTFSKGIKYLAKVTFVLTLISIFFSFSRAAILSFVIVFTLYLFYEAYYSKSFKGVGKAGIISIVFFALLLSIFPHIFESLVNVYNLFIEKVSTSGDRSGDETRFSFVTTSVQKLLENYGFGGGPGYSWNDYHNDKGLVGPHNFFLEIMVDYGLWALIYAFVLLIKIWKELLNKRTISRFNMVMSGSIIAFFLLTFSIGSTIGAPAFWSWFGIVSVVRKIKF